MKKQKTIMESHEVFCEQLKERIKEFDIEHIKEFIKLKKGSYKYADYIRIYEDELLIRENK